jgi:predicted nucleic acid-binding protein
MNHFLLDASALAKRYHAEKGSALMNRLFADVSNLRLSCLMLGGAEVVAALVRKRNGGLLTTSAFGLALTQLVREVLDAPDFTKLPADNGTVRMAMSLLQRHSINSSDGVLLQTALNAASFRRSDGDDLVLFASDQRLLRAAQGEGLITFDPETQTQADLDKLIGP